MIADGESGPGREREQAEGEGDENVAHRPHSMSRKAACLSTHDCIGALRPAP
jgi:hypothetical protein